jgi:hypothetical protein
VRDAIAEYFRNNPLPRAGLTREEIQVMIDSAKPGKTVVRETVSTGKSKASPWFLVPILGLLAKMD